jgi:hypothetical protein
MSIQAILIELGYISEELESSESWSNFSKELNLLIDEIRSGIIKKKHIQKIEEITRAIWEDDPFLDILSSLDSAHHAMKSMLK